MAARDRYNPQRFRIPFSAEVAKSVDAVDSKSTVEIRAGSSPAFGTKRCKSKSLRAAFFVSEIRAKQGFPRFPFNRSQSESTHIKSLVSIEPSTHVGSIMVVYAQRYMEG